jgi:hypothetical protein
MMERAIVRTWVNVTVYPQYNNNKKEDKNNKNQWRQTPSSLMFLLSNFHPLTSTLTLSYEPSLTLVGIRVEPNLSPQLPDPVLVVPTPNTSPTSK